MKRCRFYSRERGIGETLSLSVEDALEFFAANAACSIP